MTAAHRRPRHGGFTLVEVLVALVIMAVLAGMAWRGVDGMARSRSASNDAAHLVNEARQALLLARVGRALQPPVVRDGKTFFGCDLGPAEMTARDALSLATRGGAQVLGRSDIGHLAVGILVWTMAG